MKTRIIATALGSALALTLCLSTSAARAQDGPARMGSMGDTPTETRPVRPNRALLVTGAAIVVASYTPAVVVAATSERDGDKWLYVPVVGPWADLADRGGCRGDCGEEALNKTLLVGAGLAHIVGVGAIVASFVVPEQRTTRVALAPTRPELHVAPVSVGRNGYGLGMVGTF